MNRKCPYCDGEAKFVFYYINGTANRLNYFVQCENRCIRTKNRRKAKDAVQDWEIGENTISI